MRFAWILCALLVSLSFPARAGTVLFGSGVLDSVVDGALLVPRSGGLTAADVVVGARFAFTFDVDTSILSLQLAGKPFRTLGVSFTMNGDDVGLATINTANGPFVELLALRFLVPPSALTQDSRFGFSIVCFTCLFPFQPSLGGRVLQAGVRQAPEPLGLLGLGLLGLAGTALARRRAVGRSRCPGSARPVSDYGRWNA
jgi:hypothetical protein